MPSRWLAVLSNPSRAPQLPTAKSLQSLVKSWLAPRPGQPTPNAFVGREAWWAAQPFSVGRVQGSPALFLVPLRLVDDDLQDVLTARVRPGPVQRWKDSTGELIDDDFLVIDKLVRESSAPLSELLRPTGAATWRVTHDTPATHQRWGGTYECLQGVGPLLSRPARMYAELSGLSIDPAVFADKMTLTGMELRSRVDPAPLTERSGGRDAVAKSATGGVPSVHGALGWSTWFVRDPAFRRHVDAVLRLAEFSGVGHFTSAGFGAVSVAPMRRTDPA